MKPASRRLLYLLASAGLFAAAATRVPGLNAQRTSAELVHTNLADAATPELMFGPLLAIGRAPLVDYLWMRASSLKEAGRYFDAYQLAETIGRLQPRFAAVWAFNAWNMAYNISVTMRSAEDRWRWVRNGIELLRDQGLKHNPRNTVMYKELAWIYFHKVGDFMDDKHMYYKLQLALLMEDIQGPGPNPDYAAMAAAPQTWPELEQDAEVAAIAKRLRALGEDPAAPGRFLGLLARQDLPRELAAVMTDPAAAAARRRIEMFWRNRRLRDEAKLDPARILRLREVFGPLDFRTADANALYWANLGVEIGKGTRVAQDIDKLNTDRIELYCLQRLFRNGRLVMTPFAKDGDPPMLLPDVRYADIMRRAFLASAKDYPLVPGNGPVPENFRSPFITFLREAVMRFNEAGRLDKSREYFQFLKENYGNDPLHQLTYEQFIAKQWLEAKSFVQHKEVQNRVLNTLALACQLIASGEYEEGATRVAFAKRLWSDYEKFQTNDRYRLKPFNEMFQFVADEFGASLPEELYARILKRTGLKRRATTQPVTTAPES